jgi:3-deoxy-D-manno-octulosonic-acid transferase
VNRFISLLYEISLWILALFSIPKMAYNFFVRKKYRQSLAERLRLRYPIIEKSQSPTIWIHAVSLGETKAVATLAREIKKQYPHFQFIVSSITETGHAEAKKSLPFAHYHVYLPFDFSPLVQSLVKQASPDLVLLCESDFWYNFLRYSKQQGASIALVNGKLSERSMQRFSKVPFFAKRLWGLFDVFCIQNKLYQERFIQAGAETNKSCITGNLKLDEEYPQLSQDDIKQWQKSLGIAPQDLVLTIGSTHHPEELLFIQTLKEIWKKHPHIKVLLVPRHPERFKEVAQLLEKEQVDFICYSEIGRKTGKEKVVLIDAMGMLRMCYQLSDMAIVGGSYTPKVGGHNIIEPCWYGKPVLFGPCMHTQLELVEWVKQYRAGLQVNADSLKDALKEWIENPEQRIEIGKGGTSLVTNLKGSTKRTLEDLNPLLVKINTPLK